MTHEHFFRIVTEVMTIVYAVSAFLWYKIGYYRGEYNGLSWCKERLGEENQRLHKIEAALKQKTNGTT